MAEKSSSWFDSYVNDLKQNAMKKIDIAVAETKKEFFPLATKKIKKIYNDVITDFYEYNRKFYKPRGSLYDLLECRTDNEYIYMSFDPSKIPNRGGYYSEDDGLYRTVFVEGWHGGANISDKMLIPFRSPAEEYNGKDKPWDTSRGKGVKQSWKTATKAEISPLKDFENRFYEYQDSEYENDFVEIWNKNASKIVL